MATTTAGKIDIKKKIKFDNDDVYEGQVNDADEPHGFGVYLFLNKEQHDLYNATYQGHFENGMKHGSGLIKFSNGDMYSGEFLSDHKHGKRARYFYKTGQRYIGDYENDEMHGQGRMSYSQSKGDVYPCYVGEFQHDKRHGKGKFFWSKTEYFEGEWVNDVREGHGQMFYSNGNRFEGLFRNDKRHGKGIFFFASTGDHYEAEWLQDTIIDNKCRYVYNNGDYYIGEMIENDNEMLRQGSGTFFFADGLKYEGQYHANARHGLGEMAYYDRGEKYYGYWECDMRTGWGKYSYANGDQYDGEWLDNHKHGMGTYKYANGDVYEGEWMHGQRHGPGEYAFAATKDRFEGIFRNDMLDGNDCVYIFGKSGDRFKGSFSKDAMSKGVYTYGNTNEFFKGHFDAKNQEFNGRLFIDNGKKKRVKLFFVQGDVQEHCLFSLPCCYAVWDKTPTAIITKNNEDND